MSITLQTIPLNKVQAGMILGKPVYVRAKVLYAKEGQALNTKLITRLIRFGVKELTVFSN